MSTQLIKRFVEEVFVTEGIPQFTFVPPPNFGEIFLDLRRPGKPMIIEGQSGTGKTTCVTKALEKLGTSLTPVMLSARRAGDVARIAMLLQAPEHGIYIVDDFHRLAPDMQSGLADLAKLAAEDDGTSGYPKLVLIGINYVGAELIHLVPDLAKRMGIHKIHSGRIEDINELIKVGCQQLNVAGIDPDAVFKESQGDYWLTQQLCQTACVNAGVTETQDQMGEIPFELSTIRPRVTERLRSSYHEGVKQFCRGRRFRPSNDPYFKLLKAISDQGSSIVDLNELANAMPEVSGSINNIKEHRLKVLISEKPECERLFYYNTETKNFAIEDPAAFYYIKHLNWDKLRSDCGSEKTLRVMNSTLPFRSRERIADLQRVSQTI